MYPRKIEAHKLFGKLSGKLSEQPLFRTLPCFVSLIKRTFVTLAHHAHCSYKY